MYYRDHKIYPHFRLEEIIYTSPNGVWSIARGFCPGDAEEEHMVCCNKSLTDCRETISFEDTAAPCFQLPHEIYDLMHLLEVND